VKFAVALALLLALEAPALTQDSLNCRQLSYWEPPNGGSYSQAVAVDTSRALAFIHVWERSGDENSGYDYNRVYLLDVTHPDRPLPVGPSLRFPDEVFRMHHEAGVLYVVSRMAGDAVLWLYDVTDPVHPELLGHCDIPGGDESYGLAVSGDLAFVADGSLRIIEFLGTGVEEPPNERPSFANHGPTVVRGILNLSGAGHNPILPGESGLCPKPARE